MHNQPDFSQHFEQEKALYRYIDAFEHGDLDVMDEVLEQAMADPFLEEMIMEAHEYFYGEEKLALDKKDAARILDLITQYVPSTLSNEVITIPDLTISDVLISLLENSTFQGALKQEIQKIHAEIQSFPLLLPEKLGRAEVSQLFAHLNIPVSAKLQRLFRDKAILLSIGHQQGVERLAAARRQKTTHQYYKKLGEDAQL
jgi:hypothetical protein